MIKGNDGTIQKLQSLSELVDAIKNDHEFHEFHEPTDKWLIDQENKEYFIHPLVVDHYGMLFCF